jgi:branched-chain amino acid transport system substrate-binding protein
MNRRFRRGFLPAALLAAVLVLAACSSSSGGGSSGSSTSAGGVSAAVKGDYVLGDDDLLSGPFALYGNYTLTYIRAAVDYVNKTGGLNGHQVRLVTADAAATGQNASSAAQQLITSSNVNALVGFTVSAYCGEAAPLAALHKVPMLCYSTPGSVDKPVQPYVFSGYPENNQGAKPSVAFATGTLKLGAGTKYAVYGTDAAGDVAYMNATAKYADAAGMKQTAWEEVPIAAVNGDTQIAQLVASKPQVVFAFPNETQIQPLVESLRAAGNNAPIIFSPGGASYSDLIAAADPNFYVLTATQYVTDLATTDAGTSLLVKAMTADGQNTVADMNQVLGDVAFPQIWAMLQALKACGYPCSGTALQATLEKTSITMPGLFDGSFGWSPTSHIPYSSVYVYEYDSSTKQPKEVTTLSLGGVDD